jgi:hypothetical protein
VAAESARQGELAELMADHVLGNEHGHENLAVVHGDGGAHEIRGDGRTTAPGLDGGLLAGRARILHLLQKVTVDERAFFERSGHAFTS